MRRQIIGITRRQALAATAVASSALVLPGVAPAAPATPVPQGDDLGFLNFGAVAEAVLARFYTNAQQLAGAFSPSELRVLKQAHAQQRGNVDRLNAALGPDEAVSLEDFRRVIPLGSRAGALKVGRRLEALVTGVYLDGVGYAADPGTRILLGRLLAVSSGQHALLTRWTGGSLSGLPGPVDLDVAGAILDTYLKDPTSSSSLLPS
jgi:hypothetical protein